MTQCRNVIGFYSMQKEKALMKNAFAWAATLVFLLACFSSLSPQVASRRSPNCSAIDHALRALGVALPLQFDPGRQFINLAKVVGRKFYVDRAQIFFQPMQFGCSWDRDHPRLLCQNPGEGDLCRCCSLLLRKFAQEIY